jgi:transposase
LTQEIETAALLADKGYDSDGFIEHLEVRRIKPVIPPRANRKTPRECDFALYCERNLVERFFNIIKHFRAIATRNEKTARNFPRRRPPRLRPGLAQMTTGPKRAD